MLIIVQIRRVKEMEIFYSRSMGFNSRVIAVDVTVSLTGSDESKSPLLKGHKSWLDGWMAGFLGFQFQMVSPPITFGRLPRGLDFLLAYTVCVFTSNQIGDELLPTMTIWKFRKTRSACCIFCLSSRCSSSI